MNTLIAQKRTVVRRIGLRLALVLAASSLVGLYASGIDAAEVLCTALGSGCICSEPLNGTITRNGDFWNPDDSTTKQCSAEAASPNSAVVRTSNTIVMSSDTTARAALPAGNSMSRFLRADDNHQGTFFVGNGTPVSASFARLAARWYVWHSSDFQFKGEGTCQNSKISEHDHDNRVDYTDGFHIYNFLNWNSPIDCCVGGPGPQDVSSSEMKGKWWRFEIVMTNRAGPNFDLKMYAKNITDNGAERTVIDLSTDSRVNHLTPPALMSTILSNNHRYAGSGSCNGWLGISHYIMAGWTTNAGQRIGAANEVEGGGGPSTPFSPSNLLVQ